MINMNIISSRNLELYYGTFQALKGIDMDIEEKEITALIGPSGCGKSTFLKTLNRMNDLVPGVSINGEVRYRDTDIYAKDTNVNLLRKNIGMVFQAPNPFPMSIYDNIAYGPRLHGNHNKALLNDIVEKSLRGAALWDEVKDRLKKSALGLSGGQQQRVGVARALAADPPILLMDEPFSAVDPIVRERLGDELLALQAKLRKTIVFVTHDVDEAIRLGDRVAVLQVGGVLAQYDTPSELLRAPASEFVATFLGRERGLRRLSLMTVADVEPQRGPVVEQTDTAHTAAAANGEHGGTWVAVTSSGRLLGWVDGDDVAAAAPGAAVSELALHDFVALVTPATPLREALDVIVRSRSRIAAVIERADDPVLLGFVTVDEVAGGLET